MRMRALVLVLFALGAAMATVYFARNWIEAQRAAMSRAPAVAKEEPKTQVLVAKDDLPAGTLLKPEQLRWQPWPGDNLTSSYIVEGSRPLEDFAGAVVRQGLHAGQPITDTVVVKPGERGFLAAVLQPGMRAVSISINATTGISGFVFPGDRVDVILTQNIEEKGAAGDAGAADPTQVRRASETVLSGIRVIAVDQTANDQEDEPTVAKTATLEVTPKQAEILTLVSEIGKLSLSLHSIVREDGSGSGQTTTVAQHTYTWDSEASVLLSPPPSSAKSHTVNVLRGDKAETQQFGRTP